MGGDVSNLSFEFSHAVGDGVDILAGVGVVQIGLQVGHGLLLVAQRDLVMASTTRLRSMFLSCSLKMTSSKPVCTGASHADCIPVAVLVRLKRMSGSAESNVPRLPMAPLICSGRNAT